MVRSVFPECGALVASARDAEDTCSRMRGDRETAMPLLGCLFARYGDMVALLLEEER